MNVNNFDDLSEAINDVLTNIKADNSHDQEFLYALRLKANSFAINYSDEMSSISALIQEIKIKDETIYELTKSKKKLEALYENLYHSYKALSDAQETILTHNRLLHNLVFNEIRFWE